MWFVNMTRHRLIFRSLGTMCLLCLLFLTYAALDASQNASHFFNFGVMLSTSSVNCMDIALGNITSMKPVSCEQVNITGRDRYNIRRVPEVKVLCQRTLTEPALITLFTTMHHKNSMLHVHDNTLRLWKELGPRLRTVLFVSSTKKEEKLISLACRYEWDVYVVPYCGLSLQLPILKAMYMTAQATSCGQPSPFYGYANADILFDESLIDTLQFLEPHYKTISPVLMVGRRTDLKVHDYIESLSELHPRMSTSITSSGSVVAVDYFLTSYDYPWRQAPNMIIGRVAYDNWIIQNAKAEHLMTIELTNSTHSIHQSADNQYYKSHHSADAGINNKVLGRFDYTQGLVSCANYKTIMMEGGLHLMKRIKYGICGSEHWDRRKIYPFGIDELTVEVNPADLTEFIGEPFHPVPGT